jgi:limonene-1,2-epoxide hydrolase
MPDQSSRAVVEAFLDALKRMDVDAALGLMSDEIVYQNVPLPPDRGKPRVIRTLRMMLRFVSSFDVKMLHIAETDDGIVLTERVDFLRGPLLDLEFWVCGTFRVEHGKIVLWRDYFDLASFTFQLLTSQARSLLARLPGPGSLRGQRT